VIAAHVLAIALTVSPARVELTAGGTQLVRVTNAGSAPAVLDVTPSGFALTLRGQPRIVKSPAAWLSFTPRRLVVGARSSATLTVRSRSLRLSPGDHPALLLLTQHPVIRGGLAVRTRIGVVVSLRVPGKVVHRLLVGGARVSGRVVRVSLANRGNVTELLRPAQLTVTLWLGGRLLARFHPASRELLPGSNAVLQFRYAGKLHGPATLRAQILAAGGRALMHRAFAVKL
jgi:hypothetical protein